MRHSTYLIVLSAVRKQSGTPSASCLAVKKRACRKLRGNVGYSEVIGDSCLDSVNDKAACGEL
jgi:hypothetical protein